DEDAWQGEGLLMTAAPLQHQRALAGVSLAARARQRVSLGHKEGRTKGGRPGRRIDRGLHEMAGHDGPVPCDRAHEHEQLLLEELVWKLPAASRRQGPGVRLK